MRSADVERGSHDPLHPLAVHRLTELPGGERGDHPGAVCRMLFGHLHDLLIT